MRQKRRRTRINCHHRRCVCLGDEAQYKRIGVVITDNRYPMKPLCGSIPLCIANKGTAPPVGHGNAMAEMCVPGTCSGAVMILLIFWPLDRRREATRFGD